MLDLLKKFEIIPNDISIYDKAFTHTSYANEHNIDSYERLEFLGDALLELVLSDYLYNNKNLQEGEMTKIRASYVCENALYEYANDLNFSDYVKVGHGEESSGGKFKKTILADIFESFIAAIYLDQGFEKAKLVVSTIVIPYLNDKNVILFSDYKSALQEAVQTDKKSLFYELISEEGPAHDKKFTTLVKIDEIIYGKGIAQSKKDSEQLAAREALKKLALINK